MQYQWLARLSVLAVAGCGDFGFPNCAETGGLYEETGKYCTCSLMDYDNPNHPCCRVPDKGLPECMTDEDAPMTEEEEPAQTPPNRGLVNVLGFHQFATTFPMGVIPIGCQAFEVRWQYANFSSGELSPPSAAGLPDPFVRIAGSSVNGPPYVFTGFAQAAPWGTLASGATESKRVAVETTGSFATTTPGLDPGANQCENNTNFDVRLDPVPNGQSQLSNMIVGDGFGSTTDFGFCQPGPSCG